MIGRVLSFVGGGFGGFMISLIVFSQLIGILANADFASGNDMNTDNNLKRPETPKVLTISKRSKSALDEFTANLDRLSRKKSKLLKGHQGRNSKQRGDNQNTSSSSDTSVAIRESRDQDQASGLIFLGCVDPWVEQYTTFHVPFSPKYDTSYTPATCSEGCLRSSTQMQLIFMKGAQCECAPIHEFNSTWISSNVYCNVPCPVKNFKPGDNLGYPCGGNLGYSVYCAPGINNCSSVRTSTSPQPMEIIDLPTLQYTVAPRNPTGLAMNELCAICSDPIHRNKPYHHPDFDYFPANSPQSCVDFCATAVSYVINHPSNFNQVRLPTTYALLTWGKMMIEGKWLQLPMCRCLNQDLRDFFYSVDPSNCNMSCPGDSDMTCGGLEEDQGTYSTIYCVNDNDENCHYTETPVSEPPEPTTESLPPEVTSESPTTEATSLTTEGTTESQTTETTTESLVTESTTDSMTTEATEDPCSNEFILCEEPPSNITHSTTTEPSTTVSTSTTSRTTTTTNPTTPTTPSTTITTTMTTSSTPTTPSNYDCPVKCKKTYIYGYEWKACANAIAETPCSNLATNATGRAKWKCLENGQFDKPHPDVSDCTAPWVGEWLEEADNITTIEQASIYMDKLEEACRGARDRDSDFKYFGHDIYSITSMVDKVISNFQDSDRTKKFTKFETLIEDAVNITSLLIKYQDPWKQLANLERSNASTYIFETTESALFNLTKDASAQDYSKSFTDDLDNVTKENIFKFLIFAEKFSKKVNERQRENYEFPPHKGRRLQDSFIKLPPDWKKLVTNDDVEIAAMSMDAEYVSYIMPGQHELTSSATLEGDGDCESKLVNGKLISLTVASTTKAMFKNPRLSFSGKGAEIVFYHDIEAWGKERQDVHRKLHYNEKPRAVLGTTECVFWDTERNTWSGKGCRIISSNRFRTVCECSHLTSFAVLMDVHRYIGKQMALEVLTLILCPLSEICLILSIVILSSVNNLQRIRTTITKNLAGCLFVGNALVLLVLDRNYFNMNEGLCIGSAMLTHYVFLCAFMWMLIEGVQLYRMVIHVFDSGKSYLKHFAVFAYGSPLLVVTITATTGYLQGDKPYGGDVYCWLEGAYIWSFMGPVAAIIMINLVILFIALKTAYQLQHSKTKMSPTFFNGKIRSYRTWFKGCFSLTCILGLTWIVGFFTMMKAPSGIIAAYLFTVLNSSQGIFIFLFNCVFNEKVRSFTKRSFSTYLPSWLSSSVSSSPSGNEGSVYGKRPISPVKSTDASGVIKNPRKRHSKEFVNIVEPRPYLNIPKAKLSVGNGEAAKVNQRGSLKVEFDDLRIAYPDGNPVDRRESLGTISSMDDSSPNSTTSDNGHISSDTSHGALISVFRSKTSKNN